MLQSDWNNIITFFNSPFFTSLATILTVGGAVILYWLQKRQTKEQIAILLVNDIRNAQSAIQTVKDSLKDSLIPEITVLPENNWKIHSYLFSKDFDQDETRLINKFFSDVERISYIVTQANNMFLMQISDRNAAVQNANIKFIADSKEVMEAKQKIELFDKIFADKEVSNSPYLPSGFYIKLNKYLPEVPDILSTTVGIKLKKIATLN